MFRFTVQLDFYHTEFSHYYAIRLHYGIWPLLWRMKKPCVGLWLCVNVCVHLPITCCYQRLVTRPRVCIFPADWPQSASPLPAPWLAAQTGAPANKHNKKEMGLEVRRTFSSERALHTYIDRYDKCAVNMSEAGWQFDSSLQQCCASLWHVG